MRRFSSRDRASAALPFALLLAVSASACGHHPEDDEAPPAAKATVVSAASASAVVPAAAPRPAPRDSSETWNAAQIDWLSYDDGVRRATQQNKPIVLVVYTTWCPHCRNFSHVFDDPRVVARARDFVMVRIDSDAQPDVAGKYARDGGYIPRTYFLAPDGTANTAIHTSNPRYQYFYDEHDPSPLLASMDAELGSRRR
jgi:thiol:disulfide interchange protein